MKTPIPRLISNFFARRKRTLDKKVSFESVQYDLTRVDYRKNKISLKEDNCDHADCIPWFISKFLITNFGNLPKDLYVNARHQVYSGKKKNKHYFDLEKGRIEQVSDVKFIQGAPFREATFSYLICKHPKS